MWYKLHLMGNSTRWYRENHQILVKFNKEPSKLAREKWDLALIAYFCLVLFVFQQLILETVCFFKVLLKQTISSGRT